MGRNKICFLIGIAVLVLAAAGCQKSAKDELGPGTFEGSTYRNEFLGMTIELPTDWHIPEREMSERITETGKEMFAGDDKNMEAAMDAYESQSAQLFYAFRHPIGAPVEYNHSVNAVAERISQAPGVKEGKDYLFHLKRILQSGQMAFTFPEEVRREELGGATFDVMVSQMDVMGQQIKQEYYATIRKGYALVFILSYGEDDQREELEGVLQTLTLSPM